MAISKNNYCYPNIGFTTSENNWTKTNVGFIIPKINYCRPNVGMMDIVNNIPQFVNDLTVFCFEYSCPNIEMRINESFYSHFRVDFGVAGII